MINDRLTDVGGTRTIEEAAENIQKFTDIEENTVSIVSQALRDLYPNKIIAIDGNGVDNSGKIIIDHSDFIARGGNNFDWKITVGNWTGIVDAQVHTLYCSFITLKESKLRKSVNQNSYIWVIDEEGWLNLRPEACARILEHGPIEPQASTGNKPGVRFKMPLVKELMRDGKATYHKYSPKALSLVNPECFSRIPNHFRRLY